MLRGVAEFVVQGVTVEGEMFRQPDWAQQLCDTLGTTARNGLPYSSYLHPVVIEAVPSLVVRVSLQLADENAFETIKQFVTVNRLQVRAGRGSRDAEAAHEPERRSPQNNDW